jgi:nicotinamide mononucleotide transporter
MTNVIKTFWVNTVAYFAGMKEAKLRNYFDDWSMWEKFWLALSTVAIFAASIWTWDPTNLMGSYAALISSITGIWCVVLVAKGKISNYIWGFFNVVLYAYAAYTWKLYGDFMLNAYYFLPMQFVGWYIWTKPGYKKDADTIKAKVLSWKGRIILTLISVVATIGYGFILQRMGGNTPFLDAMSTVGSVIAMILMARMFMEQWVIWIIVDVVTVIMWANIVFLEGGMFNLGILVMWSAWLINAVYGMVNWIKMNKALEA